MLLAVFFSVTPNLGYCWFYFNETKPTKSCDRTILGFLFFFTRSSRHTDVKRLRAKLVSIRHNPSYLIK